MKRRALSGNSDYHLGLDGAGEAEGTIGGVAVPDALDCGKTGAPGAGTAGAFEFTGGTEADVQRSGVRGHGEVR